MPAAAPTPPRQNPRATPRASRLTEPGTLLPLQSVSLFWRTFFFLAVLLLGSIFAWLQTFRALEFEPRAVQSARQLSTLVNLSRAALVHSDAIARVSLVKTLVDEENVRIAVREPSDTFEPYNQDQLSERIAEALASRLGANTIVAREVNGFEGLWIGFEIGDDTFWLLADPERLGAVEGTTWLVWLAIAAALSLLGAALIARLINRPLKLLSIATGRVREGDFKSSHLDEEVATSEIREVNIGFNRMAAQLSKAEQDRTLMLAGISHDLRTPLARLRLEIEMSVRDEAAREHMAADIEQADAIIDKFLDYARADHVKLEPVSAREALDAAAQPLLNSAPLQLRIELPATLRVKADPVELRRVFANLLENALRYGKGPDGSTVLDISGKSLAPWVEITVRDHGPGVEPHQLEHLTEPFFRANEARTSATGSGLGLAIVSRTLARMGGDFVLSHHPEGGLVAHIRLQKA